MNDIVFRNPEPLTSSCTLVRRRNHGFVTNYFKNLYANFYDPWI